MLDLTNYDVEVNINKPLTEEELNERVAKGLIKHGDIVELDNGYGYPQKTEIWIFPRDRGWKDDIEMLQRNNWQNRTLLVNRCKDSEDFWAYMKEKNIIPNDIITKDVLYEIEQEAKYGEFWQYLNGERSFDNGTK